MNLVTSRENTWCPGCSNFGIMNAFIKAITMLKDEIPPERIVISAGIGCHGKIFDYISLSGVYSLHGRAIATVEGIKIANPSLKPVVFTGDGDAMGEGIAHLIFAAKRNIDITVVMHNNGVYALTTGQYSPVSEKGFKSKTTPHGSIEDPLNPIITVLDAGATFIARGYPVKLNNLAWIIAEAIKHDGFSFIEVLQPCVSFNDTYRIYNKLVYEIDEIPRDKDTARKLALEREKLPLGIFYREKKPVFHKELYGDWNPVMERIKREERKEIIKRLLEEVY